jgi:hypothetical protein
MTNCAQNKIRDILCHRDGMTPEDAQALIDQTVEEIHATDYDYDEVIDIMMNNLGLEGDYILDLLY